MKETLKRLVAGETLTSEETEQILIDITKEVYAPEQITALLMGLQMRGISVDELIGFRRGILVTGVPVDLKDYATIDIVDRKSVV